VEFFSHYTQIILLTRLCWSYIKG